MVEQNGWSFHEWMVVAQALPMILWFKWVALVMVTLVVAVIVRRQNRSLFSVVSHPSTPQDELTLRLWYAQLARGRVVVILWCLLMVVLITRDMEAQQYRAEPVKQSATIAPAYASTHDEPLDALKNLYEEAWIHHQMLVRCKQSESTTLTRWRVKLQNSLQQLDADPTLAIRIEETAQGRLDAMYPKIQCDATYLAPIKRALKKFMHPE